MTPEQFATALVIAAVILDLVVNRRLGRRIGKIERRLAEIERPAPPAPINGKGRV